MRKNLVVVLAGMFAVASLVGVTSPAQAATGSVIIHKIPDAVAHNDKGNDKAKVLIKPDVSTKGNVKIISKTLKLSDREGNGLAENFTLTVPVGRYILDTKVTYKTFIIKNGNRVYSNKKFAHLEHNFEVFRPCAYWSDFDRVVVGPEGDSFKKVERKLHHKGEPLSGGPTKSTYGYPLCDDPNPGGPGAIHVTFKNQDNKPVRAIKKQMFLSEAP